MFQNLPEQGDNEGTFEWFKERCNTLETKFAERYDEEARKILECKNEESTKLSGELQLMLLINSEVTAGIKY